MFSAPAMELYITKAKIDGLRLSVSRSMLSDTCNADDMAVTETNSARNILISPLLLSVI